MKRVVLAAAMILMTLPVAAREYLEPDHSAYSGPDANAAYHALVLSAFRFAYEDDVIVRMIVDGSNSSDFPEYAVGLRGSAGHARIFVLQPSTLLWGRSTLPPRISVCERDIDAERSKRIQALWEKMLLGARYTFYEDEISTIHGSDGDTAHFSGGGFRMVEMAGRARDLEKGSSPDLLVGIGDALKGVCESRDNAAFSKLDKLILQLERKLP